MALTPQEIDRRFGNPKVVDAGPDASFPHLALYSEFTAFATILSNLIPDSPERTIAFYQLESASLWAHQALKMANSQPKE